MRLIREKREALALHTKGWQEDRRQRDLLTLLIQCNTDPSIPERERLTDEDILARKSTTAASRAFGHGTHHRLCFRDPYVSDYGSTPGPRGLQDLGFLWPATKLQATQPHGHFTPSASGVMRKRSCARNVYPFLPTTRAWTTSIVCRISTMSYGKHSDFKVRSIAL